MARQENREKGRRGRALAAAFAIAGVCWTLTAGAASAQAQFPLKDGDTWVMAGDSITAQHLHSNYFEAFCFARFPKLTFRFRNSGVGGHTLTTTMARFDYDIAGWKPTVVSVELGMNDSGAGPDSVPAYIANMAKFTGMVRKIGARPVYFTASAVNDGTTSVKLAGRNVTLDKYATALKEFATKENAPFANQFHALLDIWGKNMPIQNAHRFASGARPLAASAATPGADLLRQWLEIWEKSEQAGRGADLMGDGVHPGPVGQLTMTAALLKDLGAPGLVSAASLDASGKVISATQCAVTNAKAENGGVSFDRLDDSLPMPIPDGARPALVVLPSIADLSRWTLTVAGLKPGNYDISIDKAKVATVSAADLAKGWEMGTLAVGPVADQCRKILDLVGAKEGAVSQWRTQSATIAKTPNAPAEMKTALDQLNEQVLAADAKIREAAKPQVRRFSVVPAR